jgi:hypothetical protein
MGNTSNNHVNRPWISRKEIILEKIKIKSYLHSIIPGVVMKENI